MLRMNMTPCKLFVLTAAVTICLLGPVRPDPILAAIRGACAECHTMHNSQGGNPMNFDPDDDTPNENLLRGDCYGCHAMNEASAIYSLGTDRIPQVLHSDTTGDLAGGNFSYIITSGSSNRGHNISDLTGGNDSVLYYPPGVLFSTHFLYWLNNSVNCAGTRGCHGYRNHEDPTRDGIKGAHHKNPNTNSLISPTEPGNSYRFLMGVKGYEDPDWEEPTSLSPSKHNEYFALTSPIKMSTCDGTQGCHGGAEGIRPPDGTMSQFCATCHGNFHSLGFGSASDGTDGVGTTAASPFIRHPTDLALPIDGEYASYTTYNTDVPVARTEESALNSVSGTVVPGTDAVMCLSCHRAHASNYPDMLRWDYTQIIAGSGNDTGGCFVCHTTKDDE